MRGGARAGVDASLDEHQRERSGRAVDCAWCVISFWFHAAHGRLTFSEAMQCLHGRTFAGIHPRCGLTATKTLAVVSGELLEVLYSLHAPAQWEAGELNISAKEA